MGAEGLGSLYLRISQAFLCYRQPQDLQDFEPIFEMWIRLLQMLEAMTAVLRVGAVVLAPAEHAGRTSFIIFNITAYVYAIIANLSFTVVYAILPAFRSCDYFHSTDHGHLYPCFY